MRGHYWVSFIVQDQENSKPWLLNLQNGYSTMKEAINAIEKGRHNFRVLSAWIETYNKDGKSIIKFHRCYIK